MNLNIIT